MPSGVYIRTTKHRESMRKAMIGRKITWGDKIGLTNSVVLKGKKLSEEHKQNIGKGLKNAYKRGCGPGFSEGHIPWNDEIIGENSHSWLGGISKEPYSFDFDTMLKESIKGRDKNTCQLSGEKQDLVIHHIDYNKKNSNSKNLITLSRRNNSRVNSNREYWTNYFNKKIQCLNI